MFPAANGTALGDGGYNFGSFTFSSPNPVSLNTSLSSGIDFTPDQKQRFFVRGNLQKDTIGGSSSFPARARLTK